jgi:hypothetical protein
VSPLATGMGSRLIRTAKAARPITMSVVSAPIRRVPGVDHLQALLKLSDVVREGRLELPLCRQSWILSPVRLPIPPLSQLPYSTRINGQINMSGKACQGVSGGVDARYWMLDAGLPFIEIAIGIGLSVFWPSFSGLTGESREGTPKVHRDLFPHCWRIRLRCFLAYPATSIAHPASSPPNPLIPLRISRGLALAPSSFPC